MILTKSRTKDGTDKSVGRHGTGRILKEGIDNVIERRKEDQVNAASNKGNANDTADPMHCRISSHGEQE